LAAYWNRYLVGFIITHQRNVGQNAMLKLDENNAGICFYRVCFVKNANDWMLQ